MQPATKILDTPLKWIGACTAVISLVLGLNQMTRIFSEVGERQRQVAELQAVAAQQIKSSDYTAAWTAIEEAAKIADQGSYVAKLVGRLDDERLALRTAQEDLAMAWLRDVRVPSGKTFSNVVDPLVAVVTRGVIAASGVRKADLLAHLGWAYFLKSRDGAPSGKPEEAYQQAIDADAGNPFAHAHWGHLMMWRRESVDEAIRHFGEAVAAGRERPYVRRLQLAAFRLYGSTETESGLLRTVDEMRRNNEPVDAGTRRELMSVYYSAFNSQESLARVVSILPPTDHIATIRALLADVEPGRAPLRDAMVALLQESAGRVDDALVTWRAVLAATASGGDPRAARLAAAAVARLSRPDVTATVRR